MLKTCKFFQNHNCTFMIASDCCIFINNIFKINFSRNIFFKRNPNSIILKLFSGLHPLLIFLNMPLPPLQWHLKQMPHLCYGSETNHFLSCTKLNTLLTNFYFDTYAPHWYSNTIFRQRKPKL